MSLQQRTMRWIEERTQLEGTRSLLAKQSVPLHRYSAFQVLGGMTLALLASLVASGVLLLLHYRPAPELAHGSVVSIMNDAPFGYVIRGVHVWSADLFIGCLLAHIMVAVIQRAYRRPRELVWLTGATLFVLCMGAALSGSLLPWSSHAWASARVSTELAARVPLIGSWLVVFLRGSEVLTSSSLPRFYGFHVAVLPGAITVAVAAHLWLVARMGLSVPSSVDPASVRRTPYFPYVAVHDQARAVGLALAVVLLAEWVPRDPGTQADPFAPAPAHARPAWYFLWIFQLLRTLPPRVLGLQADKALVALLVGALLAFFALPFIDRKGSRAMFYVGWTALIALVGATLHAAR